MRSKITGKLYEGTCISTTLRNYSSANEVVEFCLYCIKEVAYLNTDALIGSGIKLAERYLAGKKEEEELANIVNEINEKILREYQGPKKAIYYAVHNLAFYLSSEPKAPTS